MKSMYNKFPTYLVIALVLAVLVSLSITKPALAFEDITDGYIPADKVIMDDVFISAEEVIIDGTIYGDVIAAAEEVIVNGTIEGNLIMNAGTAEINGFVNGSLGFAGQQLRINSTVSGSIYFAGVELILTSEAQVNRNILFTGFSVQTQPGSLVGTDLQGSGYQVILDGLVGRDVFVDVAAAEVNGRIKGDATFQVGHPSANAPNMSWMQIWMSAWGVTAAPEQLETGLRVAPEAEIQGQLTYKSGAEQSETILADPGGGIEFVQVVDKPSSSKPDAKHWVMTRLRELLTLLALGGLAAWLLPKSVLRSSHQLRIKPGGSLGWGVISLIVGYALILVTLFLIIVLGILLAIVTLGGLANAVFGIGLSGLGIVFSAFTLLVIYGSKVVVAYLGGDLILSRTHTESSNLRILALLIGIAIYMILRFIPIVSQITGILATLLGLGGMALALKSRKKEKLQVESGEALAASS